MVLRVFVLYLNCMSRVNISAIRNSVIIYVYSSVHYTLLHFTTCIIMIIQVYSVACQGGRVSCKPHLAQTTIIVMPAEKL